MNWSAVMLRAAMEKLLPSAQVVVQVDLREYASYFVLFCVVLLLPYF